MKNLIIILSFMFSMFLNAQTLTECDERIKSYIDSDGKPYMCVVDGSRDFLFMKKIRQDTAFYECVVFHKDSVRIENYKGVVLFLNNNTRIAKTESEITLEVFDEIRKVYVYTSIISLTKEDIDKLLTYTITSVAFNKLYRIVEDGEDYKSDLFCLLVK